ncbi:septum site-determining protein Ssd [Sinomonas mesophila]|uniref:septum site-determining protein Ssd n=1 Tax=Sinomonas mesophila TaxID=1531955 RepID=UPI000985458F|nr:septum site-determining protein Ssd [Sinomonas mesophila]
MATEQLGTGTIGEAWIPDDGAVVCCITADAALREDCARVAAAAGLGFDAVSTAEEAGHLWAGGALVLLGADVGDLPPQRRHDVILVGRGEDRALLWTRAASLGVEHVAELPEAAGWLAEFLGRRHTGIVQGSVLGIVGGCGGAGASTTAALLAGAASLAGSRTLLVDGDRLGGGLELGVSARAPEGLHWPDVAAASGPINPDQLEASLPRVGGLALLSWPAGAGRAAMVPSAAVVGALDAARSAFDVVIVDVGRGREAIEDFAWASDRLLVVVPSRLGGVLSASQLVHELPPAPVGALVRGRGADGVDAEQLADAIGCPLVGRIPTLRRAVSAAESGRLLELSRRRDVRRLAEAVAAPVLSADEDDALRPGRGPASRRRRP